MVRQNPIRYVLFAMLMLYATTGDFMATSMVFVDGHDCDHPWVRIEHKCVAKSGEIRQGRKALISKPAPASDAPAVASTYPVFQNVIGTVADDSFVGSLAPPPQDAVPLRC
jgi:hypothetical protein